MTMEMHQQEFRRRLQGSPSLRRSVCGFFVEKQPEGDRIAIELLQEGPAQVPPAPITPSPTYSMSLETALQLANCLQDSLRSPQS